MGGAGLHDCITSDDILYIGQYFKSTPSILGIVPTIAPVLQNTVPSSTIPQQRARKCKVHILFNYTKQKHRLSH